MTQLRNDGRIPWNWIADTERSLTRWAFVGPVAGYLKDRLPESTINPWGDELPPLILTESKGMAEVLEATASAYVCPIAGTKGHSAGFLRTVVAPLLADARRVLYLRDRDRSGRHIEANTRRTLERAAGALDWTRIGMTEAQTAGIEPIWKVDGPDEAGDWAWEVEALGQARVVTLVRDALNERIPEPLFSVLEREDAERATVEAALREAVGGEAA